MIKLSDRAIKQLLAIKPDRSILRISVKGGGCSGMSYHLEWIPDTSDTLKDEVFSCNSLVWCVDKKSMLFLNNVQLDYSNDMNDYGFSWSNPNAKKTCGCGSSFS
jgi:iron-sulfur cluster assembly protein